MADWKGMMVDYFEAVKDVGKIEMPPFTPEEQEDPGPSAVDRGPGPAYPNPMDEEIGAELIFTLKPEVLAQLQRIEDMLTNLTSVVELVLEKSTIRPSDHQHG